MSAVRTGPARRRGSLLRSRARVARLRWRLRQRVGGVGAAVLLRGDASPLQADRWRGNTLRCTCKMQLYPPQLLSLSIKRRGSTATSRRAARPHRVLGVAMGTLGGFVAR